MYKLENGVKWTNELKEAFKHNITRVQAQYDDVLITESAKIVLTQNSKEINVITAYNESERLKEAHLVEKRYIDDVGFIGQANARQLKLELVDLNGEINLENKEFTFKIGADYNSKTYYINYGNFIVNQAPKIDKTNGTVSVTAYDYMIKFNIPYVSRLTYPRKLGDVFLDVCDQASVEAGSTDFPNWNFMVEDNQFEGKDCREVLRNIAKCAFSWARIGQDNKVYLDLNVKNRTIETITKDDYKTDSFKKTNDFFGAINTVAYAESDIKGQEEYAKNQDDIKINGNKSLVIYDNLFAYTNAKKKALIKQGSVLFGLKYMPISQLDLSGLAYLDCTDTIRVYNMQGDKYWDSIPLNHTIDYTGVLTDSITANAKSNNETNYTNNNSPVPVNMKIEHSVDRANKKITQIVSEIGDRTNKTSSITQELEKITSQVSTIADLIQEITGVKKIVLENCAQGEMLEFHLYGNNTAFKYQTLSSNLLFGNVILGKGKSILIVTDEKGNKTQFDLKIPGVLRQNGTTADEYYINGYQAQIIRRINTDGTIKDNPTIENLGHVHIKLSKGKNTLEIKDFSVPMKVKWAISNNYTDLFSTKVEMNSAIEQTSNDIILSVDKKLKNYSTTTEMKSAIKLQSDSISLEVSKKVGKNEVISEVNQSAEAVRIKANKLDINGTVSANENFKILEDGSMEAKNGNFSGEINATNGTFKNIITTKGLIGMLHYQSSSTVGLNASANEAFKQRFACIIACYIPKNFIIQNATIIINHNSLTGLAMGSDGTVYQYPGNAESVKLYRGTYFPPQKLLMGTGLDTVYTTLPNNLSSWGEMINNLGENNGYTFSGIESKEVDITSKIQTGFQCFALAYSGSMTDDEEIAIRRTGFISASLDVRGYLPQI